MAEMPAHAWVMPAARPLQGPREYRPLGPRTAEPRQRRAFPKVVHSTWQGRDAYLNLSEPYGASWKDMRAVCARHPNCTRSRSCRSNRPIGELWAWLNYMGDDSCLSKQDHSSYDPPLATRIAARAAFKSLPEAKLWLDAEATFTGVDEPVGRV